MLKKLLISGVVASLLLVSSSFACPNNGANSCFNKKERHSKKHLVPAVINAVSQVGLSASQTKKIADGISEYKAQMKKIQDMRIFPIDSFMHDEFDEKHFIAQKSEKYMASTAAQAALFKYVFAVLDKEQRRSFKNAYAAPLIKRMILLND